ncbi:MAG: hypothetical protein R2827_02315 [Bdellovibrionales bacterium]
MYFLNSMAMAAANDINDSEVKNYKCILRILWEGHEGPHEITKEAKSVEEAVKSVLREDLVLANDSSDLYVKEFIEAGLPGAGTRENGLVLHLRCDEVRAPFQF